MTPPTSTSPEPVPNLDDISLGPSTLSVGNFSFAVPTKAKVAVVVTGALFKKESRPTTGSDEERHLIAAICSDTKSKYALLSTSKTDPNMLQTTYSLTKLTNLTKKHLVKFDLSDPWCLVFPMAYPNAHALQLDSPTSPRTADLWTDYHRVTPQQVVSSCTYYYTYGDDSTTSIISTLQWSYRYFERNVKANLFTRINNDFLNFPQTAQGGPLFFKLLVDALSVSNNAHLLALQTVVYKYNIKTDCEAEDIHDAVAMLKGITDNIYSAKENVLPEQYVHKLLKVFQTTSVPLFNDHFKRLEQELEHAETVCEIDPNRLLAMPGTTFITNELTSSTYIFSYALTSFRKLQANGLWDEHVRKPSTLSFSAKLSGTSSFKLVCFNCGLTDHKVGDKICKLPIDQACIDANKTKFRQAKNDRLNSSNSKWKPPIASEGGKRILGGNPFTWSNTSNKWIRDTVPESGLLPSGLSGSVAPPPVPAPPPPPIPPIIDNSASDDASTITAATMAQMQLQMAALQRRMSDLQDSI